MHHQRWYIDYIITTIYTNWNMKINIKDIDLELHYSMRMYILYENILGKALNFENASSYTSVIVLFYSAIMATIQHKKLDITLTYDEYMDWLDEQNAQELLAEFSSWFASHITTNSDLNDIKKEEIKDADVKKKPKN